MRKPLEKGESVGYEASKYDGRIWPCASDEFTSNSGAKVVFLEGFSGFFAVEYLQRVNLPQEQEVEAE
ncbi:hypothetical protein [Bacillus atrophaeus]|uniref:hypothetical protein n=1 Tax=Bacillus atrophaeus TaxID=1452 RepID=UPI002E21E02E|nr:hypothetical protein [Bacillus atrophaeus]